MTLNELKPGESAEIVAVSGEGALRNRLIDMGLIPRAKLTLRKVAPLGDPVEIHIRGYELTLRLEDTAKITVQKTNEPANELIASENSVDSKKETGTKKPKGRKK